MVLADAEDIETDAIGMLDLVDEMTKSGGRADRTALVSQTRRGKTVDADLHVYQIWHRSATGRTIFERNGQYHAFANCGIFSSVPITRLRPSAWTSVFA
jgi:hypothetical protein